MRRPDCRRRERGRCKLSASPSGSKAAVLLQVPGDIFVDAGEQVSRRAVRVAEISLREPASGARAGLSGECERAGKLGFNQSDLSLWLLDPLCRFCQTQPGLGTFSEPLRANQRAAAVTAAGLAYADVPLPKRYASFLISVAINFILFSFNWLGQGVIDYSSQIFDSAYMSNWDGICTQERKVILMIMKRSLQPSVLTAGRVFPISMESFGKVFLLAP
ncbi:hypothetical protein QAD02_018118 [Eretmocerus hayati]|uniref:Uncharacterized protein n=1 Tax=Eretmocerus hayati TaxID=131215 RepID=A0ACC2PFS2_9HYME|nr:hypothetical protein QAD02_018118 [Eretmocerus hayati]